jgi:chromosomal replication initiator protein
VLESLWARLLDVLTRKLPGAIIDNWIRPCRLLALEGDHLKIGAPNAFSRDWLLQHHFQTLQHAAQEILGGNPRLTVVVDETAATAPVDTPPAPAAAARAGGSTDGLNPRYTFDAFVVGSSNQFAQAAC